MAAATQIGKGLRTALLALVLAGPFVAANTPAAAATTVRVHTWNMAMGENWGYNEETRAIVLYIANGERPWVVALQEICGPQFNWLKLEFAAHGAAYNSSAFKAHWSQTQGCSNQSQGTAVFGLGSAPEGPIPHPMYYGGGVTEYTVCRKVQRTGILFTACSTHMAPTRSDARNQADEVFHWWVDHATTPWILGGDFNQKYPETASQSGHSPTAEWYYTHEEIHLPAQPSTTDSGDKIDFLFGDRGAFDDGPYQGCTFFIESDHRYCSGAFVR